LVGTFGATLLAAAGATGSALLASSFTALLEMTNRRRTGGTFSFGALGLLLRVCGVCFAAVALRFNINNQTNESACRFRNSLINHRRFAASDETNAFMAVKLELRTPED
jgi:hypothetical protein